MFMVPLLCCVAVVFLLLPPFLQAAGANHNLIASMSRWKNSMDYLLADLTTLTLHNASDTTLAETLPR